MGKYKVCGFGNRTHKMWRKSEPHTMYRMRLRTQIYRQLEALQSIHGPIHCIHGGAIGFDSDFALACLKLGCELSTVLPYKGHTKCWNSIDKLTLNNIINKSTHVIYLSEYYTKDAYRVRNKYVAFDFEPDFAIMYLDVGIRSGSNMALNYFLQRKTLEYTKNYKDEIFSKWRRNKPPKRLSTKS